jgi:hypothetical protein
MAPAVLAQDFRTWSDSTGRYTFTAKFFSLDGGTVILTGEDGKKTAIDLDKLSQADQQYVAQQASGNPIKPAGENPFKPVPPGSTSIGTSPSRSNQRSGGASAEPQVVRANWSGSREIALTPTEGEWKISPPQERPLGFTPKPVVLPMKPNVHERLNSVAISPVAKRAVVGFAFGGNPREPAYTRLVCCDLERGRVLGMGAGPGVMAPIALFENGQHVLMRRAEFGFGKWDRLEIWSIKGNEVVRHKSWIPYDGVKESKPGGTDWGEHDVMWADFVDQKTLVTSSRSGRVALWDNSTLQPVCHFELGDGSIPAMSDDHKWIAFITAEQVGLFDIERRQVAVLQPTPARLQWPQMAFSPSGRKLACLAFDRILIWDTASGKLEQDFIPLGLNMHGGIDYPDDGFLLVGNGGLVALESQIKLWTYQDADFIRTVGGMTFLACSPFNSPGVLGAGKVPHPEAVSALENALKDPELFAYRRGAAVKLDVSGVPAGEQARVTESLTKVLEKAGCTIQSDAPIQVAASVSGPKQRQVRYMFAGTYSVQEYISSVVISYNGAALWRADRSNVPGAIQLKDGENIEGILRNAEMPNYDFFEVVELPERLQRPGGDGSPNSPQTLGVSKMTPTGLR